MVMFHDHDLRMLLLMPDPTRDVIRGAFMTLLHEIVHNPYRGQSVQSWISANPG